MNPNLLTKLRISSVCNANLCRVYEKLNLGILVKSHPKPALEKEKADVVESIIGELSECMKRTEHVAIQFKIRGVLDELLNFISFEGEQNFCAAEHQLHQHPNPSSSSVTNNFQKQEIRNKSPPKENRTISPKKISSNHPSYVSLSKKPVSSIPMTSNSKEIPTKPFDTLKNLNSPIIEAQLFNSIETLSKQLKQVEVNSQPQKSPIIPQYTSAVTPSVALPVKAIQKRGSDCITTSQPCDKKIVEKKPDSKKNILVSQLNIPTEASWEDLVSWCSK